MNRRTHIDNGTLGINLPPGQQRWSATGFEPFTVRDLIVRLTGCDDQDALITLGTAPGPLEKITETFNGYVILDCLDAEARDGAGRDGGT